MALDLGERAVAMPSSSSNVDQIRGLERHWTAAGWASVHSGRSDAGGDLDKGPSSTAARVASNSATRTTHSRRNWGYTLGIGRVETMTPNREVVHSDPGILGGTPVFVGTRVPVRSLFDYLEAGETLDEFLHQFPSVNRDQAIAALELARETVLARARTA
jgi:uncharacterized protein (DUF433 family)